MSHYVNESITFNGASTKSQKRELLNFLERKNWEGVQVLIGGDYLDSPPPTCEGHFFFDGIDINGAQTICIAFLGDDRK